MIDRLKEALLKAKKKAESTAGNLYRDVFQTNQSKLISPVPQSQMPYRDKPAVAATNNFVSGVAEGAKTFYKPIYDFGQQVGKAATQPVDRYLESNYQKVLKEQSDRNLATAKRLAEQGKKDAAKQLLLRNMAQAQANSARQTNISKQATEDIAKTKKLGTQTAIRTAESIVGIPRLATGAGFGAVSLGGLLSGAVEKAQGGSFFKGAGRAVPESIPVLAVTKFTDPRIEKVVNALKIKNPAVRQAIYRGVTGAGNVAEDEIIAKLNDQKVSGKDRLLSGAIGAVMSPKANDEVLKQVAKIIRKFPDRFKAPVESVPAEKPQTGGVKARGSNQYQDKYKPQEQKMAAGGGPMASGKLVKNPENPRQWIRQSELDKKQQVKEEALAAVGGLEYYKDEEGKLKVRYNPEKGAAAVALTAGIKSKSGREALDKLSQTVSKNIKIDATGAVDEAALGRSSVADATRSMYTPDDFKFFNRIKKMASSKNVLEGDVETLRTKDPVAVDDAINRVREVEPSIETDSEALEYIRNLPTKADTVPPKETFGKGSDVYLAEPNIKTQSEISKRMSTDQKLEEKEYQAAFKEQTGATQTYKQDFNRRINDLAKMIQENTEAGIKKRTSGTGATSFIAEATPETYQKIATRKILDQQIKAKSDYSEWQKNMFRQEGATRTTSQAVDAASKALGKSGSAATRDIGPIKDISGFQAQTTDIYRNLKKSFGKNYEAVKSTVLDPFDNAKGRFVDTAQKMSDDLDTNIVRGLGIKKGSPESAAVQQFGEKIINSEDLLKQFGPEKTVKIIEADKWFRQQYDQLLEDINKVRRRIYPNDPSKIIPKRENYYRHFQEISQGLSGLVNIFDSPANIASSLSGISEYTKPKSKFLSFAQKRLGIKTEVDAVGGFINFAKSFAYAKEIDPEIGRFRSLADELAAKTTEGPDAGRLNNLVEYLQDFANDLSGKTNPADRFIQKAIPGGRKAFKVMSWLNNRVKANVILGNLSSSVAQVFNVPQGIASAGKHSLKGASDTLAGVFKNTTPIDKSNFIKERYSGDVFDKFDTSMLDNARKFAAWMIQVGDVVGTRFIWNSHYEKALAENIANPIKYADDLTRSLVAGRGIGEVPLLQKSKVFQMVAPFQLEVGNLWHVFGDWVDKKQFSKFATFSVAMYLMNRAAESIRGSDVGFDPINALKEAGQAYLEEEDRGTGLIRAGGRLTGEVLSNVPLGQTVAAAYPEFGATIGDTQLPTRKDLFGKGDPTRFGSGLLAVKGLQDPLYKVLPPFGGQQVKRTVEGLAAARRGYSESKTGRVRYPISGGVLNTAKVAAFGEYSTPEARQYFDKGKPPLGPTDSESFKEQVKAGADPEDVYTAIDARRTFNADIDKARESLKEGKFVYRGGDPKVSAESVFRVLMELPKEQREAAYRQISVKIPDEVKQELFAIQKLESEGLVGIDRELFIFPEEIRARQVYERLMDLSPKNREEKYRQLVKSGVITESMKSALFALSKKK